jgi:PKD repeat protein
MRGDRVRNSFKLLIVSALISVSLSVQAANSPPAIFGPSSATIIENSSNTGIVGLSVADPDAGSTLLLMTLSASHGTLSLTVAGTGPDVGTFNGASFSFQANQTDASNALGTLKYTPTLNYTGADTIVINANDQGNGGVTTPAQTTKNIAVTVVIVNHPPTITPPSNATTPFNTPTASLPFTADDVDTPGMVTVTGTSDAPAVVPMSSITISGVAPNFNVVVSPTAAGSGLVTITLTATDSGGASSTATFTVNVLLSNPPTISGLGNQTVFEGNFATQVFNIGDAETPPNNLIVVAHSSNQTLLPDTGLVLSSNGNARTLTITPATIGFGTANVDVTVTDSGGASATDSFVFTVIHTNHAPTVDLTSKPTLPSIPVNAGTGPFNPGATISQFASPPVINDVDVGDPLGIAVTSIDNSHGTWFFTSNNGVTWPALSPTSADTNATVLTSNANTFVRFVPNPGFTGSATFTFRAWDGSDGHVDGDTGVNVAATGGNSAYSTGTLTATINVVIVNTAPSFVINPDQVFAGQKIALGVENQPYLNPLFITSISPGLNANESNQAVTFTITSNSNPGLFSILPQIVHVGLSTNANLGFVPAADQFGTATITVQAQDNGGTTLGGVDTSAPQQFVIVVAPVNHAPSFTLPSSTVITGENSGPVVRVGVAGNILAGPPNESSQLVLFTITSNSNPALFAVPPSLTTNGNLSFTPAANTIGSALIQVVLHDNGGTLFGGVDTSAPQFLTIVVAGPPTVVNGTLSVTANGSASGIFTGSDPLNFPPLPLTFSIVANGNLGKATVTNAATGAFTYTANPGASGLDLISFSVSNGYLTSNLATEFIFITDPAISSVSASPNPATITAQSDGTYAAVTFTGAATDTVNVQQLAYSWDFGDGAFGSGAVVVHHYVTAGVFSVKLTVTNGAGQTVSSTPLTVTVFAGTFGTGPDSDNDGFSDTLETAYGTNPQSAASRPPGDPTMPVKMNIEKLDIRLAFGKTNADSIALTVLTPFPKDLVFQGQRIAVDVGGNVIAFTLDDKLRGKSTAGSIAFAIDRRFHVFRFTLLMKKGTYSTSLASYGLVSTATKKTKVTVPLTVLFENLGFSGLQPLTFQATKTTARTRMP